MRLKIVLGLLPILAIAAWFYWPKTTTTVTPVQSQRLPSVADSPIRVISDQTMEQEASQGWVPPAITFESYQSAHGPLPLSLEGTQIPFDLMVDDQGNLIVDQNLRRLFDYFFTLDGEEPLETILARIEELIRKHLPQSAQERAMEILQQYVNLKQAEIELARQIDSDFNASGIQPGLVDLKNGVRDLRASNLDPETYQAFYGEENQRDQYTLERIRIQQDTSLTEEEREQALQAIEHYLPEADRQYLAEQRQVDQVFENVEQAKAQGAGEAEIFHIREQAFGAEAAERYAAADREIATWESRVAIYRDQRSAILAADGLTQYDKDAEIQALREQHFSGNELKRIPVIDKMMDGEQ